MAETQNIAPAQRQFPVCRKCGNLYAMEHKDDCPRGPGFVGSKPISLRNPYGVGKYVPDIDDVAGMRMLGVGEKIAELVRRIMAARNALDEEELRRLLGLWVSEEEPVTVVRHEDYLLLGLQTKRRCDCLLRPGVLLESSAEYREAHERLTLRPPYDICDGHVHITLDA